MDFVLDENIITFAGKMEDPNGNVDATCGLILHEFSKKCEHRMNCSTELFEKYLDKLKALKNKSSAGYVQKLLIHLKNKQKIRFHGDPPAIKDIAEEKGIPPDDVFVIRLAIHTKSVLVTADCRLKKKLEEEKLIDKYTIKIEKPWPEQEATEK